MVKQPADLVRDNAAPTPWWERAERAAQQPRETPRKKTPTVADAVAALDAEVAAQDAWAQSRATGDDRFLRAAQDRGTAGDRAAAAVLALTQDASTAPWRLKALDALLAGAGASIGGVRRELRADGRTLAEGKEHAGR